MNDDFAHGLEDWLRSTQGPYVVERTLKESPLETTQVVYKRDTEGRPTIGPFIRKRLSGATGLGTAYEQIHKAQAQGVRLEHIPLVYEYTVEQGVTEVVTEYCRGETLRAVVLREGPGLEIVARVFSPLCDAVSELHESFAQPLIHRDIKPSNIMIDGGQLKLIDLGIARTYRAEAQHDTVRYGTPGYAPPEQFGYGQTSTYSDVYALGMTLAFCLLGEEPSAELRDRGFEDERIPRELREVLARATEFDPSRRHQSARALKADVAHALELLHVPYAGRVTDAVGRPVTPVPQPPFTKLGTVWNVFVIAFYVLWTAACIHSIFVPADNLKDLSVPHNVLLHVGILIIPSTVIAYLLLDKRRFTWRTHTWKFEIPIGVGIIAFSIALTLVVYYLTAGVSWVRSG